MLPVSYVSVSLFRSWSWSCSRCPPSLVVGPSQSTFDRSPSTRLQGLQSPRVSFRCGSCSPGGSHRRLYSRLHSTSRQADENRQGEHSPLELAHVIDKMPSVSCLPEAPSKGRKICGFHAGLDDEEQPASLYRLLIGDASVDILADTDDSISSTTSGIQSKKVSILLPYPGHSQSSVLQV